ncbi:uncharacterized protein [Ptychodera flava]|uniref:uncharacterized protein n=1 Tax=Ptychodera flava TaxID=63121 RepID=UPI00396AA357
MVKVRPKLPDYSTSIAYASRDLGDNLNRFVVSPPMKRQRHIRMGITKLNAQDSPILQPPLAPDENVSAPFFNPGKLSVESLRIIRQCAANIINGTNNRTAQKPLIDLSKDAAELPSTEQRSFFKVDTSPEYLEALDERIYRLKKISKCARIIIDDLTETQPCFSKHG